MSNQIEADEIEPLGNEAAKRNRMEIRYAWAKIAADSETTPERNGAEIRDAWAKIAAEN